MTTLSTSAQPPQESEAYRLAEKLLRPQFQILDALAFAASLSPHGKQVADDHKRKKDAARAPLMALSIEELRARVARLEAQATADRAAQVEADKKHKQEKATREAQVASDREAKKFYNRPESAADFKYWSTMDFWTFDESLALLMGKDPRVMTKGAMRKEIEPEFSLEQLSQPKPAKSEFVLRYEALRAVAERATAMKHDQLRPVDVVTWAAKSGAIAPPDDLVQALIARIKRSQPQDAQNIQPTGANAPETSPASVRAAEEKPEGQGTPKKWDPKALRELAAKRKELGTAGAAKYFGITTTRVRQLLPQEKPTPTPSNPFNLGRRK